MNTIEELKSKLTKAEAEAKAATEKNTELTGQLSAVTAERDSAIAERDQARVDLAASQKVVTDLQTEAVATSKTLAARDSEIATLKAESVSVDEKARRLLAAQGHAPLALTPDTDGATGANPKPAATLKGRDRVEAAIAASLQKKKS